MEVANLLFVFVFINIHFSKKTPVEYVNTKMGGISQKLVPTYATVNVPNGMVRLIPDRSDLTQEKLSSFPRHLSSHRGSYNFYFNAQQGDDVQGSERSQFTPCEEIIRPYLYSTYVPEQNYDVRIVPSQYGAFYELEFYGNKKKVVVAASTGGGASTLGSGYTIMGTSAVTHYLYLEISPSPSNVSSTNSKHVFFFDSDVKKVQIRTGISLISRDQAKMNMLRDFPDFNYSKAYNQAMQLWNNVLGKIQVTGGTEDEKTVLYTGLYRIYERMVNITEDGKYFSGFDKRIHTDDPVPFFTDDWIWDTFRAAHPLRCIITPDIESQMCFSFIRMARQSRDGFLPTFPEVNGDSARMNGKHSIAALWDAYCKGIRGFNLSEALELSIKTQMGATLIPWRRSEICDLDRYFQEVGYYPGLQISEHETCYCVGGENRQCVAVTQAACYDDWCISKMAEELGRKEEERFFRSRSKNYLLLLKPDTLFFHPRDANGRWIMPFSYTTSGGYGGRSYYDENNGWTYRWDVQHAPQDLVSLHGGPSSFAKHMDDMFEEPIGSSREAFWRQWPDQTANIGQFTMANEPSMHIPFFFNFADGFCYKTMKATRFIVREWFRNDIMGVPGDEDGGGLSAFSVFALLGFYPFTPGIPRYQIGSPVFEKIKINVGNNKYFTIKANNCSYHNKYIQSATLNNNKLEKVWFTHDDIKNGSELVLNMGNKANPKWGVQ